MYQVTRQQKNEALAYIVGNKYGYMSKSSAIRAAKTAIKRGLTDCVVTIQFVERSNYLPDYYKTVKEYNVDKNGNITEVR